jgi:hypothetical protein
MDPTNWIINLFSNHDDQKAFFGDSYEIEPQKPVCEQHDDEDEDGEVDHNIGEEPDLHDDDEDSNEESENYDEIAAPRFDEDESIDIKELDDDDDDAIVEEDDNLNNGIQDNEMKSRKRAKVTKVSQFKKQPQNKKILVSKKSNVEKKTSKRTASVANKSQA